MLFKNEESSLKLDVVSYELPADGGDPTSDDRNWLVLRATWINEDGLIITGLHYRTGVNMYFKEVQDGVGDYPLSKEEKAAVSRSKVSKVRK